MSIRYEHKFVTTPDNVSYIELLLNTHPALFSEIYQKRQVNNIYMDSINCRNYHDNIDGNGKRLKMRIRWYGDLYGYVVHPVLEIKYKEGMAGWKERYPLTPFLFNNSFSACDVITTVAQSVIPEVIKQRLYASEPTLINHYKRRYFRSSDSECRVTIDQSLHFIRPKRIAPIGWGMVYVHPSLILELKYDVQHDKNGRNIAQSFPFRATRCSKYVIGLQTVHDHLTF